VLHPPPVCAGGAAREDEQPKRVVHQNLRAKAFIPRLATARPRQLGRERHRWYRYQTCNKTYLDTLCHALTAEVTCPEASGIYSLFPCGTHLTSSLLLPFCHCKSLLSSPGFTLRPTCIASSMFSFRPLISRVFITATTPIASQLPFPQHSEIGIIYLIHGSRVAGPSLP
jgi:hypothetical protein